MTVASTTFTNYARSVGEVFDAIGAGEFLASQTRIVLKPNVVNDSPHPVTTHPACVAAVVAYCRACSGAEIAIAEGCGGLDTMEAFQALGYDQVAADAGVVLIDLDNEECVEVHDPALEYLPTFHIPKCLFDCCLISMPVLKAHTMSNVTLSLKNMVGVAPAERYGGPSFRKAGLHGHSNEELHRIIVDLNRHRKPDLSLLDATIGMAQSHLWGSTCDPPVNKVLASFDPVAIDAAGAGLLGQDWRTIDHIRLADGVLGTAEPKL